MLKHVTFIAEVLLENILIALR